MNQKKLKEFVLANPDLVSMKQSVQYPEYYVVKYKNKVFYEDLWTPELTYCRGLVVDKDFNVISRPFNKIFNYGIEKNAPEIDDNSLVRANRKVNGFMLALTWDERRKEPLVSTTGSLDSEYVKMGKEILRLTGNNHSNLVFNALSDEPNLTHLFECVHPNDPHIVDEPVKGLYYLGSMQKDLSDSEIYVSQNVELLFSRPETYLLCFADVKNLVKTVKHEGFCVIGWDVGGNSVMTKIKSPWYLVNKLYARKNFVNDLVHNKAKELLPEEYYPLVDFVKKNSRDFNELSEQDRLNLIREHFGGLYA